MKPRIVLANQGLILANHGLFLANHGLFLANQELVLANHLFGNPRVIFKQGKDMF